MKKIKKTMRREDGFTLVELLAVIVILGIILAIAIPAIGGVINRAQSQADNAEYDLAIDAARVYFTTYYDEKTEVTIDTLIKEDYLQVRGGGEFSSDEEKYVIKENTDEVLAIFDGDGDKQVYPAVTP